MYYFEPEGPGWSDYQDDDGIELKSNAEALAYAYTVIRELKADREGSSRPTHLLVKNAARKVILRISFEQLLAP
jgi:phage major head subunit gpT-like protein